MRNKMLGLAIALTTFGLGVAATTIWIAYHTPDIPAPTRLEFVRGREELVSVPETVSRANEQAPCAATPHSASGIATSSGGVLNSEAISKPAPAYPAQAMTEQIAGTVVVFIVVNECGKVVMASAVSGHPLLRHAAEDAAFKWRFSPTFVYGKPAEVSGVITFNFLLQ